MTRTRPTAGRVDGADGRAPAAVREVTAQRMTHEGVGGGFSPGAPLPRTHPAIVHIR